MSGITTKELIDLVETVERTQHLKTRITIIRYLIDSGYTLNPDDFDTLLAMDKDGKIRVGE